MTTFVSQLEVAERAELACLVSVANCAPALQATLAERGGFRVTGFWSPTAQPALVLLSLATGGAAGLAAVLTPGPGGGPAHSASLAALHAECLSANKTAVLQSLRSGRELFLAALPGRPAFWCARRASSHLLPRP